MVHYTFQHMNTITKLSQNVTQYYKNITSPIDANARIQIVYNYELYKRRSRVTKENLESREGSWKDRVSDGLPMIHALAAHLWSATGIIYKLQAPRSGHEDPGELELPNEWCSECQGHAGISTRVSINLNQKCMYWKPCREYMHTEHERGIK